MNTARGQAVLASVIVAGLGWHPAQAADRLYVYNMTTATEFKGVYLAPAGTTNWGANQALNDKDHSLDVSERLAITGLSRGRFDVRLQDDKGRTCLKRGVDLTKDASFEIREEDLATCH
ncbi:conserved exported protein of unknown function [Rhodovastum atsumiense]|uniref:Uncharacterized protein n=1 Tax=Rhodovastum atsumiense TaxID=504468 RepID=A0A5M6IQT9_9PROT|nr:hypothetical protein [Rhodovastum atsumiense]KAA5610259.1 hypothetical protein F1189_19965 [Rhodovastum atsumiense]CAH2602256.1 conserved exported protein of unknown function [Rhodovastum atsumiense]